MCFSVLAFQPEGGRSDAVLMSLQGEGGVRLRAWVAPVKWTFSR
jgi:hypothetical protein